MKWPLPRNGSLQSTTDVACCAHLGDERARARAPSPRQSHAARAEKERALMRRKEWCHDAAARGEDAGDRACVLSRSLPRERDIAAPFARANDTASGRAFSAEAPL